MKIKLVFALLLICISSATYCQVTKQQLNGFEGDLYIFRNNQILMRSKIVFKSDSTCLLTMYNVESKAKQIDFYYSYRLLSKQNEQIIVFELTDLYTYPNEKGWSKLSEHYNSLTPEQKRFSESYKIVFKEDDSVLTLVPHNQKDNSCVTIFSRNFIKTGFFSQFLYEKYIQKVNKDFWETEQQFIR